MPEFDNVVPERAGELEPLGNITVKRQQIILTEFELLNYTENSEVKNFEKLADAFNWASEDSAHMHEFVFPLAGSSLAGSLNPDPEQNREVLMLTSGARTGVSPKEVPGEYYVATDNKNYFNIVFFPDQKDRPLFRDRSIYVSLPSGGGVPELHFTFNIGPHTAAEMAVGLSEVLKKITRVTNSLLGGV